MTQSYARSWFAVSRGELHAFIGDLSCALIIDRHNMPQASNALLAKLEDSEMGRITYSDCFNRRYFCLLLVEVSGDSGKLQVH